MWKKSLVAAFHRRTPSVIAQSAPLISSDGPRPYNTATLEPIHEQDQPEDDNFNSLEMKKASPPVPKLDPTQHHQHHPDIESNPSSMRTIRSVMMEEIDTAQASAPLTAYCFMTGFMYVSRSSRFFGSTHDEPTATQCAFLPYSFGVPSRQAILYKYVVSLPLRPSLTIFPPSSLSLLHGSSMANTTTAFTLQINKRCVPCSHSFSAHSSDVLATRLGARPACG